MMAGGVIGAGIQGGKSVKGDASMRKTISATNAHTSQIQAEFSKLQQDADKLDNDMQQNITQAVTAIQENRARLVLMKGAFAAQMKKLQLTGLIVVSVIFFLLVFKWSGLEGLLIKAFKDVIHKHKTKKSAKKAAKAASKTGSLDASGKVSGALYPSPHSSSEASSVVHPTLKTSGGTTHASGETSGNPSPHVSAKSLGKK